MGNALSREYAAYIKLVELALASSTPLSLGGYDTLSSRHLSRGEIKEPLRTQSIKGVIRWWTRAIIAGVLYTKGLNGKKLINDTIKYSSLVWGSSAKGASGLKIHSQLESMQPLTSKEKNMLSSHSRLILIGLSKRKKESKGDPAALFKKIRGTLTLEKAVWSTLPSQAIRLGVYSLVLSFTLGCLGKASRRGLGCFDINVIDSNQHICSLANKAMIGEPIDLIKTTIQTAKELTDTRDKVDSYKLPSIPAIARGVFRLYRCQLGRLAPLEASVLFSQCITRKHRRDKLVTRKIAWILGLPRSQKGTGYEPKERDVERRASPIIFSVHNKWGYMSVFYSSDWPSRIIWRSRKSHITLSITDNLIRDALDTAVSVILDCMKRRGLECEEVNLW